MFPIPWPWNGGPPPLRDIPSTAESRIGLVPVSLSSHPEVETMDDYGIFSGIFPFFLRIKLIKQKKVPSSSRGRPRIYLLDMAIFHV